MAFIIKPLGVGNIAVNTTTDLYTVPAGGSAIVNNVRLVNPGAGTVTASVYFRRGGVQYRISERNKIIPVGDILVIKPELTLAAGDAVESSTSAAVDAIVCGLERE